MTPQAAKVDLSAELERIVLNRITHNKLSIPAMPEAALACMAILKETNWSFKDLAAALARDPLLSVQVMRIANSAGYGNGGIKALDQAVTFIGVKRIQAVLVEASAAKLFVSRDPAIKEACRSVWEHCIAVAILARDLVSLSGSAEGETAYLTGLLHDVGKPILAAMLLEAERQIGGPGGRWIDLESWLGVLARSHQAVGNAVAESWGLPEAVKTAIRDCTEYDSSNRSAIANYVRFANAVAKVEGISVGPVDVEDAKAMIMIGRSLLGLEDEVVKRLTADLKTRAHSLAS